MPVESATYISQLNPSYPAATDGVQQGDDHIRLVKSVLQSTFPNVTGAVTKTNAELNAPYFPTGGIIIWSGASTAVPTGWGLCDGSTYSKVDGSGSLVAPDLRNRFVIGAAGSYAVGSTGGSTTATATSTSAGSHTHTESAAGSHSHGGATGGTTLTIDQIPAHTHTISGSYVAEDNNYSPGGLYPLRENTPVVGTYSTTTSEVGGGQSHSHTISADGSHSHTIDSAGTHAHDVTVATVPPYFALAYIIKL